MPENYTEGSTVHRTIIFQGMHSHTRLKSTCNASYNSFYIRNVMYFQQERHVEWDVILFVGNWLDGPICFYPSWFDWTVKMGVIINVITLLFIIFVSNLMEFLMAFCHKDTDHPKWIFAVFVFCFLFCFDLILFFLFCVLFWFVLFCLRILFLLWFCFSFVCK